MGWVLCPPGEARAATVYFEHQTAKYLNPGERAGGAALVPDAPQAEALPLVVFLHGTNPTRSRHLWLGGGGHDLRPIAASLYKTGKSRPFVLAGPSQTRGASRGRELWSEFDLNAFVDDVAQAVEGRARIDRSAIVLMGHSGAGCNLNGGLTSALPAGGILPTALVAVDPCLDAKLGAVFAQRPVGVPLWLMWQARMWPREAHAFEQALTHQRPESRIDRIELLSVPGADPHNGILPLAFERVTRELFARHELAGDAS